MEWQVKLTIILFIVCMIWNIILIFIIIDTRDEIRKLEKKVNDNEKEIDHCICVFTKGFNDNSISFNEEINKLKNIILRLNKGKIKKIILTSKEDKIQTTINDIIKIKETPEILKATDIYGQKYRIIKEEIDFEIKDAD